MSNINKGKLGTTSSFVYEAGPQEQKEGGVDIFGDRALTADDLAHVDIMGKEPAKFLAGPTGEETISFDRKLYEAESAAEKKRIANEKISGKKRLVGSVERELNKGSGMRMTLEKAASLPALRAKRVDALVHRQKSDETSLSNMRTDLSNIEERKAELQQEFSEKEVALEDAALKASEESRQKLANISNKLSAIRAQNPSEEIFGGTWGVAAMLLGSLRQGLYGGKNEAVSILNKKVEEAAKYQLSQVQNMKELKKENKDALQAILDESENDKERLENTKSAILDEIKVRSKQIVEQYKIDIDRPHLAQLFETVLDSKNKIIDNVVSDNQSVASARVALAVLQSEVFTLEAEAKHVNNPLPTEDELEKEYTRAYTGNDSVAKTIRKNLDVVRVTSNIIDQYKRVGIKDGYWNRIVLAASAKLPAMMLGKAASDFKIAKALANLQLTSVLRAAGEGGKMSDKDKDLVQDFASSASAHGPTMEARVNQIITEAESGLAMTITNAADRRVFKSRVAMSAVLENMPRAGQFSSQPTYRAELDKLRGFMTQLGYKKPLPTGANLKKADHEIILGTR
jgi:hypothetical protein